MADFANLPSSTRGHTVASRSPTQAVYRPTFDADHVATRRRQLSLRLPNSRCGTPFNRFAVEWLLRPLIRLLPREVNLNRETQQNDLLPYKSIMM